MWQFSLCNIRFPCKRLWSEQVWSDIPPRDPLSAALHNLTILTVMLAHILQNIVLRGAATPAIMTYTSGEDTSV